LADNHAELTDDIEGEPLRDIEVLQEYLDEVRIADAIYEADVARCTWALGWGGGWGTRKCGALLTTEPREHVCPYEHQELACRCPVIELLSL